MRLAHPEALPTRHPWRPGSFRRKKFPFADCVSILRLSLKAVSKPDERLSLSFLASGI